MRVDAVVICLVFVASVGALRINRSAAASITKKDLLGTVEPIVREGKNETKAKIGITMENDPSNGETDTNQGNTDTTDPSKQTNAKNEKPTSETDPNLVNAIKEETSETTEPTSETTSESEAQLQSAGANNEEFLKNTLQLINKYRQLHAAPPLVLSLNLTAAATKWATKLAAENQELLDVNAKYGQTLFSTKEKARLVERAVQSWYNQIRNYDFHSPKATLKATYFTQLVWVKSKEIGIAKQSSSEGKEYVVAFYSPAGNEGNFLHNVLPVTGSGVGKSGPSSCSDGYKFYDNSCYKYFPGPRNWLQATERCTEEFASLASIESSGEDYFIRSLLTANQANEGAAWIGLSDLTNPGTLSWVDGTQHTYGNYDTVQGNFQGRRCGVTYTQTNWKYKPCDGARGFVCRRRLRGETTFEVVIRYVNKVWTESLENVTSHRYQALSKHLEAEILDVYNDDDWFDKVSVDHFSQSEGKILAFCKLSFTPDDDSPPDPIQKLREKIENGTDHRTKRSLTKGVLHGEQVELVKVTMVIEEKSCPNYCVSNQCAPQACSPWCCDAYGQQYYQGNQQQQPQPQQQQQQQQPCGSYPYAQGQSRSQCSQYPYQPVIRPQYQQQKQQTTGQNDPAGKSLNGAVKKANRTSGGRAADQPNLQAIQPYPGIPQQPYYQSVGQTQPYSTVPQYGAPMQYPNAPQPQSWRVEVFRPVLTMGSSPVNGQPPNPYPSNQYQNQMPFAYQNQYQPQVYNPNSQLNTRLFDPATRSRVRDQLRPRGGKSEIRKSGPVQHRPRPPLPGVYPARYQAPFPRGYGGGYPAGGFPTGYQGAYPAAYTGGYPARNPYPPSYPRPYAMPYPRIYPAGFANPIARMLPRPNFMPFRGPPPQPAVPVNPAKRGMQPRTCPTPCPDSCAPDCTQDCCMDRR